MYFEIAKPVWGKDLQCEKNITCGFYTVIDKPCDTAVFRVATSGFYRIFINGRFVHHGPVRCAHGFYRVDELPITEWLTEKENHIAVEVVNYYINSFYYLKQPGFIQMEIEVDGAIKAATAENLLGFSALRLNHRIRKMQRYSFQRTFGESYRLNSNTENWRMGKPCEAEPIEIEETEHKALLLRELPINKYPDTCPDRVLERGEVSVKELSEPPYRDRSVADISEKLEGYKVDELEFCLSDDVQTFAYERTQQKLCEEYTGVTRLTSGKYETLSLPTSRTGFPVMKFKCFKDTEIYLMYDEELDENGDVSPLRVACLNVIKLEIKAGECAFQGMEPMGFKYLKLVCLHGDTEITGICMREAVCPISLKKFEPAENADEALIFEAARQTFIQNAYDLFTDCPSRERAGWLCDSFFIGRMERFFTGANLMEKQYLENFLLPEKFEHIPEGMLPMCYPSDHFDGGYIPNWALWYVLELFDYYRRTNDRELVDRAYSRIEKLLEFFKKYENEDGLLEGLEGWVFVEWSKANDLVQDVNFPSNMTYSAVLKRAGELYDKPEWIEKGENIAETVRRIAYDGEFFVDNQVYKDGKRVLSGERTETCQYYAFFFGIATPEDYPQLWKKLITEFGPKRAELGLYPEIYPSNAFIGNYLRLDILLGNGLYDICREQIVGYFTDMARRTGTLWENMTPGASCNHGFASYAAYLLYYSAQHKQPFE